MKTSPSCINVLCFTMLFLIGCSSTDSLREEDAFATNETSPIVRDSSYLAPDIGPKPIHFEEPQYPMAARRRHISAELVVEVLVDEKGQVQEAKILERYLLEKKGGERVAVPELKYGFEKSSLAAAKRWIFRPAQRNGKPVSSYTTLTFSFGV